MTETHTVLNLANWNYKYLYISQTKNINNFTPHGLKIKTILRIKDPSKIVNDSKKRILELFKMKVPSPKKLVAGSGAAMLFGLIFGWLAFPKILKSQITKVMYLTIKFNYFLLQTFKFIFNEQKIIIGALL